MKAEEHTKEFKKALGKLTGKKIVDITFKPYNSNCLRIYITTNNGKVVMSFCRDWKHPELELRNFK